MKWTQVDKEMPKIGQNVLITTKNNYGGKEMLLAAHFGKFELEADDGTLDDDLDYDERLDLYFSAQGWYECCSSRPEYQYTHITDEVTHWAKLPAYPTPALTALLCTDHGGYGFKIDCIKCKKK